MRSTRTSITLCYNERVEVENGVWENELIKKVVRAEQENIFQSRRDRALADSLALTARFSIRSNDVTEKLDYVEWKGKQYKVRSIFDNTENHFSILELGELV